MIIDFDRLERDQDQLRTDWATARPFPLLVLDSFGDPDALRTIEAAYPDPSTLNKSRDYIFAKEKYEKNHFAELHPLMGKLHTELLSARFQAWLSHVTGIDLFVDPDFVGGGLHSGGVGSFLDMHADFNVHPGRKDWLREINILLYLNHGWQPDWGGCLKLLDAESGETREIEPIFNRCVLMLTKEHTLHGYDPISFPPGRFRRSIAGYAYSPITDGMEITPHSTMWQSDRSLFRRAAGPVTLRLVALKNRFFGSASIKNR
ncbi:2OG-Fe(II) oxygenase [Sandaracinobacteroides hominis]|uniref:2OG-Fe(II) oxygenase n=1 Tax=Sandaracinobacteroides hominis TaxID=2780086 RepID=UPI0018F528FA|nr:2OG-Fe(II) oxygenase [Sandaracinobacteroides hominis]